MNVRRWRVLPLISVLFAAPTMYAESLLYTFQPYYLLQLQLGNARYFPSPTCVNLGAITFTAVGDTAGVTTTYTTSGDLTLRTQSITLFFNVNVSTLGTFAVTDPLTLSSRTAIGPSIYHAFNATPLTDPATGFFYNAFEEDAVDLSMPSIGGGLGAGTQLEGVPTTGGLLSFSAIRINADTAAYTAVTPEPSSLWLLGSGACVLMLGTWRRRAHDFS